MRRTLSRHALFPRCKKFSKLLQQIFHRLVERNLKGLIHAALRSHNPHAPRHRIHAVLLRNKIPKGVSGKSGVFAVNIREIAIVVAQNGLRHALVIHLVPRLAEIRRQALGKPCGQVHQIRVFVLRAHLGPRNGLRKQNGGHAAPDLSFKGHIIALEIQKHLVVYKSRNAARVVARFAALVQIADIALLKVAQAVKHNKFEPLVGLIADGVFHLRQAVLQIVGRIESQIAPFAVKINIKSVETIIRPKKLFVLHPLAPETHLRTRVELRLRGKTRPCRQRKPQKGFGNKTSSKYPHKCSHTSFFVGTRPAASAVTAQTAPHQSSRTPRSNHTKKGEPNHRPIRPGVQSLLSTYS